MGDLHTDTLLWQRDFTRESDYGHVDLPRLQAGNVAMQMFTAVTRSPTGQNYESNSSQTMDTITALALVQAWPLRTWGSLAERALYQAERLHKAAAEHPEQIALVSNQSELAAWQLRREAGEPVIAALLGTEGSHALDGELANIDRLVAAGYSMMGLQHFFDNKLGGSLHGHSGEGLTNFGRSAVKRMLELEIMIDVAHSSEAVVREVLAMSDRPLIVSHTGFNGHCDTPRNISDELMVQIADAGGLIGVGYWDAAVCDPSPDGIVSAMRYGIDLVGLEHVALGSDYDGAITAPFDTSQLALLTDAMLRAEFTEKEIRLVMGGNMLRFLRQQLPEGE